METVTVERNGWCDEETQAVEELKELIWQFVSMIFGEVFDDIDEDTGEFFRAILQALVTDDESGENTSDSGEEFLNFLKNLTSNDSDESSELMEGLSKFLESLDLDSSEEKSEQPASSENEIPNTEENEIPTHVLQI
ncbi:hypothetical protein C0J52_19155 [Blattella germanica]|nr:hypothetical protein C0J52_19155 [Blattella germanica]